MNRKRVESRSLWRVVLDNVTSGIRKYKRAELVRQLKELGIMGLREQIEEVTAIVSEIRESEVEQDGKLDQLRTYVEELRARGNTSTEDLGEVLAMLNDVKTIQEHVLGRQQEILNAEPTPTEEEPLPVDDTETGLG